MSQIRRVASVAPEEGLEVEVGASSKNATRCEFVDGEVTDLVIIPQSDDGTDEFRICELKRQIGEGHAYIRRAMVTVAMAARITGCLLLELKSLTPHGEWSSVRDELARQHGLTSRTAQLYMRVASQWDQLRQTYPELEQYSLRVVQTLIAKRKTSPTSDPPPPPRPPELPIPTSLHDASGGVPETSAEGKSDRRCSRAVRLAAVEFFAQQMDRDISTHPLDSKEVDLCKNPAESELDNDNDDGDAWRGNLFGHLADDQHLEELVARVVIEFATESITQAILVVPIRVDARWMVLLDSYPRVWIRPAPRATSVDDSTWMVVGIIERENLALFDAAFRTLGPVLVPFSFFYKES